MIALVGSSKLVYSAYSGVEAIPARQTFGQGTL